MSTSALRESRSVPSVCHALTVPSPTPFVPVPRGWLLAGLVLLCLVPRALMAWKLDAVCRDGVFYIHLAESIERRDVEAGLGKLRLNTYPPVLALLHSLGLDWECAGECWGVGVASLTVLPLFGWARRQFDDRVATIACLLYAVHPKLIEWSPELVRDPTFWFLWSASLYTGWRAAVEGRSMWYVAAGTTIALASHTRFEGWCLYLPLVWWSACQWLARQELRRAIVANLVLSFAVCPFLIALVNVTWLANSSRWELGNFSRLEYVAVWYHAVAGGGAGAPTAAAATVVPPVTSATAPPFAASPSATSMSPPSTSTSPARASNGRLLWMFANSMRRGVGALFGLLWLVGFAAAPRTWLRRDQVVLFLVAAVIAGGIWIHLWYAQATSSRYFLALVLIACPCAATGWLRLCDRWASLRRHSPSARSAHHMALAGTFILLAACGVGEALADRQNGRRREAALGQWLLSEFGPGRRLATSSEMDVLAYYARASAVPLPGDRESPLPWPANPRPDLAVLSRHGTSSEQLRDLVAEATALGYKPLDHGRLPPGYDFNDLVVLER